MATTEGAGVSADGAAADGVAIKSQGLPSYWAHTKKRFAILFGYSGEGYKGLQVNPGQKTIEGELEAAICRTGVIKEENKGNFHKSAWTRAARTDKGVHALGQVVSLKTGINPEQKHLNAFVEAVNRELPSSIRVFDVIRTTGSFNAKNACSGRKYEYMLPTYLLAPPEDGIPEIKRDPETGELEVPPMADTEIATLRTKTNEFRLTEEIRAKLNAALAMYEGTHNFHNFTPKMGAWDPKAKRYIVSCSCDPPREINGVQIVRIKIEGQSFMLHQIRKMMTIAVEVTRRGVDPSIIRSEFLTPEKDYNIAMAPGEGLALRACLYKYYNEKFGGAESSDAAGGSTSRHPSYRSIQFEKGPIAERVDVFRREFIYPSIIAHDTNANVFLKWKRRLDHSPFPPPKNFKARRFEDYGEEQRRKKEKHLAERRLGNRKRFERGSVEEIDHELEVFWNERKPKKKMKLASENEGTTLKPEITLQEHKPESTSA